LTARYLISVAAPIDWRRILIGSRGRFNRIRYFCHFFWPGQAVPSPPGRQLPRAPLAAPPPPPPFGGPGAGRFAGVSTALSLPRGQRTTTVVLRHPKCGYIISTWLSRASYSLVLDETCLKDPSSFWGLSSDLFPEKQRGDADGPGAACWDLPGCGSDPRKQNPLPGSVFGRVWSCLVRSTSLSLSGLLCCLNWVSGITGCTRNILFMVPVHDELFLTWSSSSLHIVPTPRHTWEPGRLRGTTHTARDSFGGTWSLLPWAQRQRMLQQNADMSVGTENETRGISGFPHPVVMSPTAKPRIPGHRIRAARLPGESRYGENRGKKEVVLYF
jgi:hypothetical protein